MERLLIFPADSKHTELHAVLRLREHFVRNVNAMDLIVNWKQWMVAFEEINLKINEAK